MKAAVLGENGIEIREVARPVPGPAQVLVNVRAAGLNRADLIMASGAHARQRWRTRQRARARVRRRGRGGRQRGDSGSRPGERVMCSGNGGYAEYAVADWGRVSPIPANNMGYEQAATLPVALQTMHDALVTAGRLKAGEAVLIQGASSGVGLMGLQIAKLKGARLVIGTSTNAARRERLKEFGADLAVDTTRAQLVGRGVGGHRRQGRRPHRRPGVGQRRQREPEGGRRARAHRQRRPARRLQGRVRFRPARAEAHRLHRRHLPHALGGGGARDRAAHARRPVGRRRERAS